MEGVSEVLRNGDRLLPLLQLKPLLRQRLPIKLFTTTITSPFSRSSVSHHHHHQSSTDHKLFKERLVGEVLPKHVDVLEDGLDDCVDVPLPVVRQLHRYQHQAEPDTICNGCQSVKVQRPGHEEVLVCGDDVVGQPLLLQVGEQRARTSVAQQVAQVPARSN